MDDIDRMSEEEQIEEILRICYDTDDTDDLMAMQIRMERLLDQQMQRRKHVVHQH